ncbi:MAG: MFS transporter [Planctomycetota bacterium]
MTDTPAAPPPDSKQARFLFATCFVALVATSFAFIIRALIVGDWAAQFNLSETQKGEIFGAGIWPFAISIILFSFFIDRIGYGKAMVFAFACHFSSVFITIFAWDYWSLYAGNFIAGLGAGTVEAAINPVIAAMYPKAKTKWLNILHAGWPGGLVLGGLLALSLNPGGLIGQHFDPAPSWHWKVGLLLIPTLAYGVMLLGCRFPQSERVAAGVPYMDMLKQFGAGGAFIALGLVLTQLVIVGFQIANVENPGNTPLYIGLGLTVLLSAIFFAITKALGHWLFLFLLLIMILLATTEIGTDGWIGQLMGPVMEAEFKIDGGWVLVYTATIMMVLRLFAGPIVKALNPLGLLAVSCVLAACGLAFLSTAQGLAIIAAATVYGLGQTFFWPTTLGLIAERFPKGGALTLNAIAGVGMLGVGILGFPFLGNIQDRQTDRTLAEQQPALYQQVISEDTQASVLGSYRKLDVEAIEDLDEDDQATITNVQNTSKQSALLQVAALPLIMLVCYLALLVYFKKQGGYKAIELT